MKQPLQSDDSDVYEDFKAGLKSEEGKKRSDSDIARSANDDPKLCSKKARVSLAKVDRHDGKKRRRIFQQGAPPKVVESDSEYEVEEVIELCEWYPPDFWKSGLNLKVKIGGPLLSYDHCPNSAPPFQDSDKDSTRLTDVTACDITVTLRESRSSAGFFKQSVR